MFHLGITGNDDDDDHPVFSGAEVLYKKRSIA
jgi:hypothetical protein